MFPELACFVMRHAAYVFFSEEPDCDFFIEHLPCHHFGFDERAQLLPQLAFCPLLLEILDRVHGGSVSPGHRIANAQTHKENIVSDIVECVQTAGFRSPRHE